MNKSISIALLLVACIGLVGASGITQDNGEALPADGETATARLTDSPRHGEWVDIDLPGEDAKLKTWVVYPERSGKAPVVIVIHEIFGLTDWVRAVADQLAAEGFIAVAPDLLSGKGPNGGGTESFTGDAVREAIRKITPAELETRLNAVRAYATTQPAATTKTGVVGYCWGGSMVWVYATQQPALNAAVVYYGTAPMKDGAVDVEALKRIPCPVLGLYGEDDARVTSTVAATEEAMKDAGKSFAQHTYEKAGHGFLRQQSGKDGANKTATENAWAETVRYLKQQLE